MSAESNSPLRTRFHTYIRTITANRFRSSQSTPHRLPGPDSPPWHHLWGPNQWPSSEALPKFRPAYEEYMQRMSDISMFFTSLIAESIGLESNAFDKFFDEDQQHKLKLVYVHALHPSCHSFIISYRFFVVETVLYSGRDGVIHR